jgi:hypothetical protein
MMHLPCFSPFPSRKPMLADVLQLARTDTAFTSLSTLVDFSLSADAKGFASVPEPYGKKPVQDATCPSLYQ